MMSNPFPDLTLPLSFRLFLLLRCTLDLARFTFCCLRAIAMPLTFGIGIGGNLISPKVEGGVNARHVRGASYERFIWFYILVVEFIISRSLPTFKIVPNGIK